MKNKRMGLFCLLLLVFGIATATCNTVFAGINCLGQSGKNIGVSIANGFHQTGLQSNVWSDIIVIAFVFMFVSQYVVFIAAWLSAKSRYRKNKKLQIRKAEQNKAEIARILQASLQKKEYDPNVIPIDVIKKAKSEMQNR